MTRKILTAKPEFIEAVKAEIKAKQERHGKILEQVKAGTSDKLKRMQNEQNA